MKARTDLGLMELRDANGRAVTEGDEIKDFRGAYRIVTGAVAPVVEWSPGRVELDGYLVYPSVAHCAWHRIGD